MVILRYDKLKEKLESKLLIGISAIAEGLEVAPKTARNIATYGEMRRKKAIDVLTKLGIVDEAEQREYLIFPPERRRASSRTKSDEVFAPEVPPYTRRASFGEGEDEIEVEDVIVSPDFTEMRVPASAISCQWAEPNSIDVVLPPSIAEYKRRCERKNGRLRRRIRRVTTRDCITRIGMYIARFRRGTDIGTIFL
jgi:hypothetical protein